MNFLSISLVYSPCHCVIGRVYWNQIKTRFFLKTIIVILYHYYNKIHYMYTSYIWYINDQKYSEVFNQYWMENGRFWLEQFIFTSYHKLSMSDLTFKSSSLQPSEEIQFLTIVSTFTLPHFASNKLGIISPMSMTWDALMFLACHASPARDGSWVKMTDALCHIIETNIALNSTLR